MKNSTTIPIGTLTSRLMRGTALAGLAALAATSAQAQNENVVITGTTIRGQQPVGANVISVDRAAIEATGAQTTAQLLVTIPQLDNFGAAAQGGQNSADGSGTQAPTIHSLGNSASNATLILIDGHRLPLTGINHNLADPSVIPTAAIANVEVLPDGASAIYGSDAVAGVINFHTRKDYSGWETSVQYGMADSYNTFNFSQMFGHSWEDGGMVAAYNYSNRSHLMNKDREFVTTRQDLRLGEADHSLFEGAGTSFTGLQNGQPVISSGGNFQNFTSCPVATIANTSSSTAPVYVYPYTGSSVPVRTNPPGGPGVGICDTQDLQSLLPSEIRNSAIVSIHQALNDSLVLNADAVYSSRLGTSVQDRNSLTRVRVFSPNGTGGPSFGAGQRNPFYVATPADTAGTQDEWVSLAFYDILSDILPVSATKTGSTTAFATVGLDYDIGGDWLVSLGGTAGTDFSFSRNQGDLNSAEAILALNGTTNTNGTANNSTNTSAIADPYGLETVVSITRALTTANALDVWRPKATNLTSPAVLRSLVDSFDQRSSVQAMQNLTLHADGPLLDLFGAGDVKAAIGGEWIHYTQDQYQQRSNNAGPVSTTARTLNIHSKRTVYAAYAEIVVPVISPDMNIPLMQRLVFDFAGRYDHYNDFGDTKNPKISFQWDIVDGLSASASFGTSFTAPALDSIGQPGTGITGETGVTAGNTGASNNLVIPFNDTRPFNDGAGIAGTIVSNAVACKAAGSIPVDDLNGTASAAGAGDYPTAIGCQWRTNGSPGLSFGGGNAKLKPQLGQSYSANLLFDFGRFFDLLDGLTTQVTYYQAKFTGAVTNIATQTTSTTPGIPGLTTFGPANGCTFATLAQCGPGGANEPGWAASDSVIQDLLNGRPLGSPLPTRMYSIIDRTQQNAYDLWQNGIDFKIDYRWSTDTMGDFTFTLSGNQILRATQKNGPQGELFDTLDGKNGGRYANIELTGRLGVTWRLQPYTLGVSYSFQHPYQDGNNTFPYNFPGPGRAAGYQHVEALQRVDLNAAYDLPDDWLNGTTVSLNINNLFDTDPPYWNSANGYVGGSPIGRMVSVSIRKTW